MTVSVVQAPQHRQIRSQPGHGDLPCLQSTTYTYVQEPEWEENTQTLPLAVVNPNPWQALRDLDINADAIKSPYKCPYTEYTSFGIVPICLISANLLNYIEAAERFKQADYWLDYQYHQDLWGDKLLAMTDIQKLLLGSGYTYATGWNDGTPQQVYGKVNLDNGDSLFVYYWEWYNK